MDSSPIERFARWQLVDRDACRDRRREQGNRKRAELDFTAEVRAGTVRIRGAKICEVWGHRACWGCGLLARVWYVARWVPTDPTGRIGYISQSDSFCVRCIWARMVSSPVGRIAA